MAVTILHGDCLGIMARLREGFDCILIEREAAYVADIRRRLDHVKGADTPLFAGGVRD